MSWLLNTPIAHRGLHNSNEAVPENSLLAFEKAVQKNLPIELDVRILRDNTIVVFHDFTLYRLAGINKHLSNMSFSELHELNLYNTSQKIPTLKESLDYINGSVPILIEIKNEGRIKNLEPELLKILKQYKGDFAVQSFNPFSLMWFKENAPGILRGQLSSNFKSLEAQSYKKLMLQYMFFNRLVKPDFISYDIASLPNRRVSGLRNKGVPVLSWTIKNKDDLKRARLYSDNFIFENIYLEYPVDV